MGLKYEYHKATETTNGAKMVLFPHRQCVFLNHGYEVIATEKIDALRFLECKIKTKTLICVEIRLK